MLAQSVVGVDQVGVAGGAATATVGLGFALDVQHHGHGQLGAARVRAGLARALQGLLAGVQLVVAQLRVRPEHVGLQEVLVLQSKESSLHCPCSLPGWACSGRC